ncbi:PadR family transcriptional regulator [Priestia endophytica]|uniref:PadR family transcriptional regulator n=1 Tax=Priestia endophytica TaxID=135735 RepID=UPI0020425450|nr:PadR family transcriptional regulator [Priestia endophytica]MCM3537153.1 PadR family transcriptional regulator [Priestia endophytica]
MDEKLASLKKAMKNTVFKDLQFTDRHRRAISSSINGGDSEKNKILFAVLQLVRTEKTGMEILTALKSQALFVFEGKEGMMYTFLHELENKRWIVGEWKAERKYYKLTEKGAKVLGKASDMRKEVKTFAQSWSLGE